MAGGEAVEVQVVSSGGLMGRPMCFRMKPEAKFGGLMNKWCAHHGIALEKARFTAAGVELGPASTLAGAGLPGRAGAPLLVQAAPRVPENRTRARTRPAAVSGEVEMRPRRPEPSSDSEDGEETEHEREPGEEELEVTTSDDGETTDASCSPEPPWSGGSGSCSSSSSGSPAPKRSRGSVSAADGASRVHFRVVAPSDGGDNVVVFTMPPEMPLKRLMAGWCRYHGLSLDAARFVIGGHELTADDTPLALGIASVIPEHLVGVTPLDERRKGPRAARVEEVEVRALPRRPREAPGAQTAEPAGS